MNPNLVEYSKILVSLISLKKTHEQFVKEYLSQMTFFYNAADATKISLREKAVKKEKIEKVKHKAGRPKKGEIREPIKLIILKQHPTLQLAKYG